MAFCVTHYVQILYTIKWTVYVIAFSLSKAANSVTDIQCSVSVAFTSVSEPFYLITEWPMFDTPLKVTPIHNKMKISIVEKKKKICLCKVVTVFVLSKEV